MTSLRSYRQFEFNLNLASPFKTVQNNNKYKKTKKLITKGILSKIKIVIRNKLNLLKMTSLKTIL